MHSEYIDSTIVVTAYFETNTGSEQHLSLSTSAWNVDDLQASTTLIYCFQTSLVFFMATLIIFI